MRVEDPKEEAIIKAGLAPVQPQNSAGAPGDPQADDDRDDHAHHQQELAGRNRLGGQLGKDHNRQRHLDQQLCEEGTVLCLDDTPVLQKHAQQDHRSKGQHGLENLEDVAHTDD
jgi:hypothetical protein